MEFICFYFLVVSIIGLRTVNTLLARFGFMVDKSRTEEKYFKNMNFA